VTSKKEEGPKQKPFAEGLFYQPPSPKEKPHLIGSKCRECGYVSFPRTMVCPICMKEGTMNEVALSTRAKINSFTVARVAPQGFEAPYVKAGAPITLVLQKERPIAVDAAGGGFALPTVQAHPSAATVFTNWLLSKEGQSLFAVRGYGYPSLRADVPPEGVLPIYVPRSDERYFYVKEHFMRLTRKLQEKTKQVIQEEGGK